MAENGEEKLLAVARHIAKTLGHNDSMANDILQIFSNFDGRFSLDKFSDKTPLDDPTGYAALQHTLNSLRRQISQYLAVDHPIWSDSADSSSFLDSIDQLIATIRDWTSLAGDKTVGACLVRAEDLMQQAVFRLEDEFRSLMGRGGDSFELSRPYRKGESAGNFSFDSEEDEDEEAGRGFLGDGEDIPVAHPLADYDIVIDALPPGIISDLHEIAKRMVAAGFGKECSHAYSIFRREFLEESLSRLGLQKLSIDEVQKMPWQDLEEEILRWVKGVNVALRILFPSERRLCDRVFFGLSSASDLAFMEVCRGATIQLLNFADAVAIGSRAPERLFKVLDLFETLRDLMPEFESLFCDQYCILLRNEAFTIWKRLGDSIRFIFVELENLIRRDPAKAAVPGGGLHPIARYVINYLCAACRSQQTLEQVFEESSVLAKDYAELNNRASSSTSFSVQMAWIVELLESNLEVKSKIYKDPALCYVFMMNNTRYIVQKVRNSELGSLLGVDWIRKHTAKIRQYHGNYQRSSWNKLLGVLKIDNGSVAPNVAANSIKDRLKSFNLYLEEICKTQSTWVICDAQLRHELRISVAKILVPPYQDFVARYQNVLENGKRADRYIKYSTEDLEARTSELFQGIGGSASGRK